MVPNFDEKNRRLQRLLALKRHETPPPGFFERFPNRVLINIRAGTEMETRPWWQRFYRAVLNEPMVAGSYAALGLGALLFGVSVFQMALDHEAPAVVALDGIAATSPGLPLTPADNLPAGVIYRVSPAQFRDASESTLIPSRWSGSAGNRDIIEPPTEQQAEPKLTKLGNASQP